MLWEWATGEYPGKKGLDFWRVRWVATWSLPKEQEEAGGRCSTSECVPSAGAFSQAVPKQKSNPHHGLKGKGEDQLDVSSLFWDTSVVNPMPGFLLVLLGAGSVCGPRKSRNGSGHGGLFCCFWYRDGNYSRRCCFVFKFELCNQPVQLKGRRLTSCQQFRARAFCKALRAKEASAERLTPLVRFGEVMQADSFRRTPYPAKSARIKKEKK